MASLRVTELKNNNSSSNFTSSYWLDTNTNMSANVTEVDYWEPSLTETVIITVIFGIILLTGIVGNVLVILLLILVRKMHSVVNLCLGCLAVADLIVVVFLPILPIHFMYLLPADNLGQGFCTFLVAIDRGAIVCSLLIFLLIGVERYTVLVHPLKSIGMWTYKRVSLLLVVIWVVTVGLGMPYVYAIHHTESPWNTMNASVSACYMEFDVYWLQVYETSYLGLFLFLPIPLLIFMYGQIILVLRKKRLPGAVNSRLSATTANMSRSQSSLMLVVVVFIFVVCILPFRILVVLRYFTGDTLHPLGYRASYSLEWTFRLMLYVNHALNPVVYFLMSANFREAFRVVFCKVCHRRRSLVERPTKATDISTT